MAKLRKRLQSVDIKTLALILLLGRLIAAYFMVSVVKRQYALSKLPIEPELKPFRNTLNYLATAILTGIIIFIVIDVLTIATTDSLNRGPRPAVAGIIYTVLNCIVSIVSAYLIWTMYRQAAKTVIIVDKAKAVALQAKK